jgi:hypothetical protein
MRALVLCLALTGCGGGNVVIAEGARATSCLAVEEGIIQAYEAGHLTQAEARAQVDCLRASCDLLHTHITEGADE